MVVHAESMATQSRWRQGRCSSKITTRAKSPRQSSSAMRCCMPAILTAALEAPRRREADKRCWLDLTVAPAVAADWSSPMAGAIRATRHVGATGPISSWVIDVALTSAAGELMTLSPLAIEAAEEAGRMLMEEGMDRLCIGWLGPSAMPLWQNAAMLRAIRTIACRGSAGEGVGGRTATRGAMSQASGRFEGTRSRWHEPGLFGIGRQPRCCLEGTTDSDADSPAVGAGGVHGDHRRLRRW